MRKHKSWPLLTIVCTLFFSTTILVYFAFKIHRNHHEALKVNSFPATNNPSTIVQPEIIPRRLEPKKMDFTSNKDLIFPKKFLFGTAYSDFQTAGIGSKSDWHKFISELKEPKIGPGIGNDLYTRYREDFNLAGQINIQIHRISLDWSKFEPEPGKWNMEMVKTYARIFQYMRSKGIEPMICMNHFPHPQWFADMGGWENPNAPELYARYAQFLVKEFGIPLKIRWWLTYNEPQVMVGVAYGKGGWPPFKYVKDLSDTEGIERLFKVSGFIMDGHRLSYRAIHKALDPYFSSPNKKLMVGIASAPGTFYPNDPDSSLDKIAFNFHHVLSTMLFDRFIGNYDRDFIGINYYGIARLKMHISVGKYVLSWLTETKPFAIEWVADSTAQPNSKPKFYPAALYEQIMRFSDAKIPIFVTENGIDDGTDKFREEFLTVHLSAIHKAIEDGANVIGYQYWALTDTWEPGDYRFSEMGMIKIDRTNNLTRSLRPSALVYGEIIKTHKIKKELLEKHKDQLR